MKPLWALLFCFTAASADNRTAVYVRPYAEQMVEYYAAQCYIPANMVRAVIRVESNWNPGAVSSKGGARHDATDARHCALARC